MAKNISKGQSVEAQGDGRPVAPSGVYIHPQSGQMLETARGKRAAIQGDAFLRLGFRLASEKEVEQYKKSKDDLLEVEKAREAKARELQANADKAKMDAVRAKEDAEIASAGADAAAAEADAAKEDTPKPKTETKSTTTASTAKGSDEKTSDKKEGDK